MAVPPRTTCLTNAAAAANRAQAIEAGGSSTRMIGHALTGFLWLELAKIQPDEVDTDEQMRWHP